MTRLEALSFKGKTVYVAAKGEVLSFVIAVAVRVKDSLADYEVAYPHPKYKELRQLQAMRGSYVALTDEQMWKTLPSFCMLEQTAIAIAYEQIQREQHLHELLIKDSAETLDLLNKKYDNLAALAHKATPEVTEDTFSHVTV